MAASVGGHVGGLKFSRLLNLIDRTAYRQRHVAYKKVHSNHRLPTTVATIMIGKPEDGLWWNLKTGVIPEYNIKEPDTEVDETQTLELMYKYGMATPEAQAARQNISKMAGRSMFSNPKLFKKKIRGKLEFSSWRYALVSMLANRAIRGSAEAERLLGTKAYREAMTKRRKRETVHYDMNW